MISAAKRRLFCTQMHFKVLEKVNVLKKETKTVVRRTRSDLNVIIIFNINLKPNPPKERG